MEQEESIKLNGQKDFIDYWTWLNNAIMPGPCFLYKCNLENSSSYGYAWFYPISGIGYEVHQCFDNDKELRRRIIECAEAIKKQFWSDVSQKITHLFAHIPVRNKPSIFTALRIGFKQIGLIPEYDNGDVKILLLRRS